MNLRILKSLKWLIGVLKFKVLKKANFVGKEKGEDQYHYQGSERQSYTIQERIFQKKGGKSSIITRFLPKETEIKTVGGGEDINTLKNPNAGLGAKSLAVVGLASNFGGPAARGGVKLLTKTLNLFGGEGRVNGILNGAEKWLGPGYKEIDNG